ncbi:hypothetical protein BH23ACT10_BH23ACT10_31640 [soil metagenome]
MPRRTDAGRLAPIIGIMSALVVLGATAAPWVEEPVTRAIRDVTVSEVRVLSGFEFSPSAPVAALVGLVCSFGLVLRADRVRRVASVVLFAAGIGGVAAVAVGLARIMGLYGAPTATPLLALVGGAGMVGAAVLGMVGVGRSAQRLPARYDVDVPPDDDEWEIASDTRAPRRELP